MRKDKAEEIAKRFHELRMSQVKDGEQLNLGMLDMELGREESDAGSTS